MRSPDRPFARRAAAAAAFLALVLAWRCRPSSGDAQTVPAPAGPPAPSRAGSVTVLAAGDVMMAGSAFPVLEAEGPDFAFDSTRAAIGAADFSVANLEAPFGTGGRPFRKTYTFRVPPRFAPALLRAGFDAVNLANNHILDYGPEPFAHTLRLLDSLGIAAFGAGAARASAESGVVLERSGWKAAFLGFSLTYPEEFWASPRRPGTAFAVRERIAARIDSLRGKADLVAVSFHWGKELHSAPEPYQREFAHAAIDAGADLVIGHHPHVLQGFEVYQGKPIAYSLGNFVFGSRSASCRESALFVSRFDSAGFAGAEVVPLCVDARAVRYQPRALRGSEAEALWRSLARLSAPLNGGRSPFSANGRIPRP